MGNFIRFIQGVKDKLFGVKPQQPDQKPVLPEPPSKEILTEKEQPAADSFYNELQSTKADDRQTPTLSPPSPQISGPKDQVPFHIKPQPPKSPPKPSEEGIAQKPQPSNVADYRKRDPYFIQIGFDFGTSFSKCICRDVMIDKAWVYVPPEFDGKELPFLIPSCLKLNNGAIQLVKDAECQYPENGLYYLKLALEQVALGNGDASVLDPYRNAIGRSESAAIKEFVKGCGVYFLAETLGQVRKQIRRNFPNFGSHEKDYMAVNMAVPVADAERPEVNKLYQEILDQAWILADELAGCTQIGLPEFKDILKRKPEHLDPFGKEACFIYPEVSANVQGFVRSRASSPGIYLFSDTGAGSVDQSVFIFGRNLEEEEYLTYLHGSVLPLGSSHIERLAAKACGNMDWRSLESWRGKKENGGTDRELTEARDMIAKEVGDKTETTLAWAKGKLFVIAQLNGIRVIFGGGGHCDHPYKTGVLTPFFRSIVSIKILSPLLSGFLFPKISNSNPMRSDGCRGYLWPMGFLLRKTNWPVLPIRGMLQPRLQKKYGKTARIFLRPRQRTNADIFFGYKLAMTLI